jgi:hypothetical protein
MPSTVPKGKIGCLENRHVGPHLTTTIFSLRECAPAHTDPHVKVSHCIRSDMLNEMGLACYPIGHGQYHCI